MGKEFGRLPAAAAPAACSAARLAAGIASDAGKAATWGSRPLLRGRLSDCDAAEDVCALEACSVVPFAHAAAAASCMEGEGSC